MFQQARFSDNAGRVQIETGIRYYRQAVELQTQSLAIAREIGDRQGEGATLGRLGFCHSSLGSYRLAIGLHTQSLAVAREIGDRQGEGRLADHEGRGAGR